MASGSSTSELVGSGAREFVTTHWSVVLAGGDSGSPRAAVALEKLCHDYWYPLYAYVRRRGHGQQDAQDLTQGFFARLLQRHAFRGVVPGRAKFRSFLLAALNNFLADEHDRQQAQKRGGGRQVISFDAEDAEERYRLEPPDAETPEKLFDRRWAISQSVCCSRRWWSPERTNPPASSRRHLANAAARRCLPQSLLTDFVLGASSL